ncbi:MAG: hypothetical protein ACQEUZ_06450 [Pseudomonadota bacterium]
MKHSDIRRWARQLVDPGAIGVSELADHWRVDRDTARRILRDNGVRPAPGPWKRPRYGWFDIWRMEGERTPELLAPDLHGPLKAPLLVADEVAEKFGMSASTVRRYAGGRACGSALLPAIRLRGQLRWRAHELEAAIRAIDDAAP